MNALVKAAELAGGTTALARKIGRHPAVITNWKSRGVPVEACIDIEKALNGQVRCEELNSSVDWAYLRGTVAA
ncbi:transcriptional regulator [Paraburkholderia atlantica]|uniref:transcriptional regulator n=1 Tax=Paraburkholderia atlantica TaxID=2654982 RepID=UPI0016209128|nr:YdaS family helix-turn-helix protein [Paraburkholderia atlantica]MBB5509591.1 DNA-binding transcriptional regulator YdaS (Cro superfamily) [Paraburkholderia atlantica]